MTVSVHQLAAADVPTADHIFRLAFATFLGMPDPLKFAEGADLIGTRFRANPSGCLGAYDGASLVGSCLLNRWGSFAFLGPITVHPDFWDKRVGQQMLFAGTALLDAWNVRQSALFTFAQSTKHVGLYQRYGFWPQHLTAILGRTIAATAADPCSRYSTLDTDSQASFLAGARDVSNRLFEGLDLTPEIAAVESQRLGDTVFLSEQSRIAGFAICHAGPGSEAEPGQAYIKFAAVRGDEGAEARFDRLLDGCEAFALERKCPTVVAGVNTARHAAYRRLLQRGYRSFLQGVAMMRPNDVGFNRPDCFVLDDWR